MPDHKVVRSEFFAPQTGWGHGSRLSFCRTEVPELVAPPTPFLVQASTSRGRSCRSADPCTMKKDLSPDAAVVSLLYVERPFPTGHVTLLFKVRPLFVVALLVTDTVSLAYFPRICPGFSMALLRNRGFSIACRLYEPKPLQRTHYVK